LGLHDPGLLRGPGSAFREKRWQLFRPARKGFGLMNVSRLRERHRTFTGSKCPDDAGYRHPTETMRRIVRFPFASSDAVEAGRYRSWTGWRISDVFARPGKTRKEGRLPIRRNLCPMASTVANQRTWALFNRMYSTVSSSSITSPCARPKLRRRSKACQFKGGMSFFFGPGGVWISKFKSKDF
jgi:hypothetical protein